MTAHHPLDRLPKQLWLASQQAARRAVLNYRRTDDFERIQSAVNLGLAAEVLLMASVATIDTSFLADSNSPQSKLALSRNGNPSGRLSVADVKTISWEDARKLMLARDGKLVGLADWLKQVMNTRNAAAHAGLTESDDLGASVVSLVRIVAALHEHLDFSLDDYWGATIRPMVTEVQDKMTSVVRQSKTAKVITAEKEYVRITERFAGASLAAYTQTALERPLPTYVFPGSGEYEKVVEYDCPACGNPGHVFHLGQDDDELEPGYDDQLDEEYIRVFVYWAPRAFECQVCNLTLTADETELLDEVQLDASYETFDHNSDEYELLFERVQGEPDPEFMFLDLNDD